jgi:hypothetical protein
MACHSMAFEHDGKGRAVEKSKIWNRWKAGESLHEIGRAFDKPHSSIRCLLLPTWATGTSSIVSSIRSAIIIKTIVGNGAITIPTTI